VWVNGFLLRFAFKDLRAKSGITYQDMGAKRDGGLPTFLIVSSKRGFCAASLVTQRRASGQVVMVAGSMVGGVGVD